MKPSFKMVDHFHILLQTLQCFLYLFYSVCRKIHQKGIKYISDLFAAYFVL